MIIVLFVSATLLVLILGLKHFEFVRGQRVFEHARVRLDRRTNKANTKVVTGMKHGIEYVHKDVLLNGLHMVTYVALMSVRFVERKLEKIIFFIKSFRKKDRNVTSSNLLRNIRREYERKDVEGE